MGHTIKVIMRMDKLSQKTNEAPVCIRITKNRQHTYKTLFRLDPKFWDAEKGLVKKSHSNASTHNATIRKAESDYDTEIVIKELRTKSHGVAGIRDIVHKKQTLDFMQYAIGYVEQQEVNGNYGNYKKFRSIVNKFRNFVGKDSLQINSITPELINRYEKYLSETLKNGVDTITVNLKALRMLYFDVVEKYNLEVGINPFKQIKFKRTEPERGYLTDEELDKFLNLKCRPMTPHANAREIFLFECFTGVRIGDILTLKWRNYDGSSIAFLMQKTTRNHVIPLNIVAKEIVEFRKKLYEKHLGQINPNDYIFDMLKVDVDTASKKDILNAISSSTAMINRTLKSLAKRLDINKRISTHIGRHTLGTHLAIKDANIFGIQGVLGHKDIRTTQIYITIAKNLKQNAVELLNDKQYERGTKIFDDRGGSDDTESK